MTTQITALAGLAKVNLREQALTALRSGITSGNLPPGTHLVETELSEQLQISRGTLREAMRQLQQEGLISAGPRGRLSVRSLDTKEILDIFAVRGALESLAVRELSVAEDRGAAVVVLRKAIQAMQDAIEGTLDERIEADLNFHRTLCRLTGNAMLLHSWEALEGNIRMSIMWAGQARATGNMRVDRHSELVDVIESGDAAAATDAMFAHMDAAASNLVS
ncbi:DNA-binding GntR family transcriptional regulator [Arthrobacter pigmenti]|uniref:DNA-binding GntR family transcriptional regulator n=1 Tax=Arthrobacter pigmenti TaxID=271432 RepID=A0A846RVR5_9MICC|nr:GntR family transcriptional regulator [Arthrobacter pigmenti]NJC24277.1 DNA-binding GntR family transcriptional regulator [Arthrobacter pigmenti]